ncbi:MAG TPA: phosphohydrolase, partial [Opitutae bacterium]|nr:phosphohydrolase [Opitutae bacterium]
MIQIDTANLSTIAEVKSLEAGTSTLFQSVLLLEKITTRTARNGSDYLVVDLADRTGKLSINCFSNSVGFDYFKASSPGHVVHIEAQTDYYQGKLSPRLLAVMQLPEELVEQERWLPRLIESAPEDASSLWADIERFIQKIENPRLRATVQEVFNDVGESFKTTPGAISIHHAYHHGLMEHTVHIARAAEVLLPLYPEVHADLALAGILLHDMGKTIEYTTENRVTQKSRIGILQGHVVLGYRLARKAAIQHKLEEDLLERLEHIILSHQGELEWGAAAMAATPEAIFVSLVDNLDAKMGIVQ